MPTLRASMVLILTPLLSCESTDRMLKATEQAVAGRTGRDVIAIIGGKNPSTIARERLNAYAQDPERLLNDLRPAQKEFQALYGALSGNVREQWARKKSSCLRRKSM